jgi:hypothetical protein
VPAPLEDKVDPSAGAIIYSSPVKKRFKFATQAFSSQDNSNSPSTRRERSEGEVEEESMEERKLPNQDAEVGLLITKEVTSPIKISSSNNSNSICSPITKSGLSSGKRMSLVRRISRVKLCKTRSRCCGTGVPKRIMALIVGQRLTRTMVARANKRCAISKYDPPMPATFVS